MNKILFPAFAILALSLAEWTQHSYSGQTVKMVESHTRVAVSGKRILMNDHHVTLMGFRLGSAALRDDWTNAVISQLDLWREKGINAMIIWLQGSSGGFVRVVTPDSGSISSDPEDIRTVTRYGVKENALTPNGRTTGTQVVARLQRIIEEADKRGMAVIVGFIYRRALNGSDDRDSILRALRAMAMPFGNNSNIIYNIWNEADNESPLEYVQALTEYVQAVKSLAPGRPVAAGTGITPANLALAALGDVDLICHDMGRNGESALRALQEAKPGNEPVVNVESFAGRGAGYIDDPKKDPGVPPVGRENLK